MDEEQKSAEFRQLVQEMRDAMAVDFAMKLRHEDRIKEHEQWLRENEQALARHRELMIRIDENLAKLSELILRGRPTNGNQT
jgi:hypothetical protein